MSARRETAVPPRGRVKVALVMIALGLPGVFSLLSTMPPLEGMPRLVVLANPVLLLVIMAFVGAFAAPACGFRSRIAASLHGQPAPERGGRLMPVLILGIALGVAVALADHATRALWQASASTPPSLVEAWSPAGLLVGVLYGGVVEEIAMRFGLMSLVVLGVRQIGGAGGGPAPGVAVAIGVIVSAALFAAGHLPALAAAGIALDPPLVVRTLLWNGLLGIVFGVLFARRDLESAMAAHAGFHLGLLPALLIALAITG